RARGVVAPVIGTVYMPITGIGTAPAARDVSTTTVVEDNPLRLVHAAELAQLRNARARAAAKADIEAALRVLERLADCGKPPADGPQPPTELAQKIKAVSEKIDQIGDRLDAVEKLALIHENYIRSDRDKRDPMKPMD